MHGDDRITLRLDFQRTNHHPERIELVQHRNPLRFVRLDVAADRPEVTAALAQLESLGVPVDAGRDTASAALRKAGFRIRNDVISEAIKIRKTCPQDRGTGVLENDQPEIEYTCPQDQTSGQETAGQACPGQAGDSGDSDIESEGAPPVPDLPVSRRGQVRDGRLGRWCPSVVMGDACAAVRPLALVGEVSATGPCVARVVGFGPSGRSRR